MCTRSFNSQILMDTDMLHTDGLNVRYRAPPISVYEAVIGHILSNHHHLHLFLHTFLHLFYHHIHHSSVRGGQAGASAGRCRDEAAMASLEVLIAFL